MGRGRRARRARASWAGAAIAVLAFWSCAAAPLVETDRGFVHPRHGYRVGAPPGDGGAWERISVKGSALAYARPGPVRMTLSSRCGIPLTQPRVLARHLRIGVDHYAMRHEGDVSTGTLEGWEQVFDVAEHGALVRVKTVTFVAGRCVLDWVLTARDGRDFEAAEADFDAWWRTLRVELPTDASGIAREGAAP